MDNFFELRKIEENKRGEKCFISALSGMFFNGVFHIEKYVAIRNVLNHFTLEVFSSNFDFTKFKNNQSKNFYLGDNNSSSYYLLNFVISETGLKIEKKGAVVFINGITYLPLSLAYDLCTDKQSKKLIEEISKINV